MYSYLLIILALYVLSSQIIPCNSHYIHDELGKRSRVSHAAIHTTEQFTGPAPEAPFGETQHSYLSQIRDNVTNPSRIFSITADIRDYSPFDEIMLCYYSSYYHATATIPPFPISSSTPDILISADVLPFFLACCPTIPFAYDVHSFPLDPAISVKVTFPFSESLSNKGCGFSILNIPSKTPPQEGNPALLPNGSMNDSHQQDPQQHPSPVSFPNLLLTEHYRNPRQWYNNYVHGQPITIFTSFSIPYSLLSYTQFPSFVFSFHAHQQHHQTPSPSPSPVANAGHEHEQHITRSEEHATTHRRWRRVECQNVSLTQGTEGYHRTLSVSMARCNATTSGTPPESHHSPLNGSISRNTSHHDESCQYSLFWHLPNGVFVDPYQLIDYTKVAQKRRHTAAIDDTPINATDGELQMDDIFLSFYDFIDVEAQQENARGVAMLIHLPTITAPPQALPLSLSFPLHLRYSISRHNQESISGIHKADFRQEAHVADTTQHRSYTSIQQPILLESCLAAVGDNIGAAGCGGWSISPPSSSYKDSNATSLHYPPTNTLIDCLLPYNQHNHQNFTAVLPRANATSLDLGLLPPFVLSPVVPSVPVGDLSTYPLVISLTTGALVLAVGSILGTILWQLIAVITTPHTYYITKKKQD